MKKIALFCIAATLLPSSSAFAKVGVAQLRALAPAGYDIAHLQESLLRGSTEAEALLAAKGNYIISDFNKDGRKDAIVIYEGQPTKSADDYIIYQDRVIQAFLGQADGSLKFISENKNIVLMGDEGGVFGDPLVGLRLNKKGSVILEFYGGSNWKWGHSYVLQFRKNNFYYIGSENFNSDPNGYFVNVSSNFLTGVEIIEEGRIGEKSKFSRKKIKRALIELQKIAYQMP